MTDITVVMWVVGSASTIGLVLLLTVVRPINKELRRSIERTASRTSLLRSAQMKAVRLQHRVTDLERRLVMANRDNKILAGQIEEQNDED